MDYSYLLKTGIWESLFSKLVNLIQLHFLWLLMYLKLFLSLYFLLSIFHAFSFFYFFSLFKNIFIKKHYSQLQQEQKGRGGVGKTQGIPSQLLPGVGGQGQTREGPEWWRCRERLPTIFFSIFNIDFSLIKFAILMFSLLVRKPYITLLLILIFLTCMFVLISQTNHYPYSFLE